VTPLPCFTASDQRHTRVQKFPEIRIITPGSATAGGIVAGNISFVTGQLFGTSASDTITFIPAGYWGPSPASQPLCFFFPRTDANFNGYVSIWNEQTRSSAYPAGLVSQDASGNWEVTFDLIVLDGFYSVNQVSFFCAPKGASAPTLPPPLGSGY
jgi:hypothetical protein